jgi:hypothetical protein
MTYRLFLTAIAAGIFSAASCTGRANNQATVSVTDKEITTELQENVQVMDDVAFSKVVQEIFLKLPKEVLPAYAYETPEMRHPTGEDVEEFNCRQLYGEWRGETDDGDDFTAWWRWDMAAYLADDSQNAVVIIIYRDKTSYDEHEMTVFTLNYHIKSGKCTEIELDEDPPNLMEKLPPDNEKVEQVIKQFFYSMNYTDYVGYAFFVNGYQMGIDLLSFWYDTKEDGDNSLANILGQYEFHYKWNGKRFVLQ